MGPKCKYLKTGESIRKDGRKEEMQEEREGRGKKNQTPSFSIDMNKLAFTFFSVRRFRLTLKTHLRVYSINQTSVFLWGCNV